MPTMTMAEAQAQLAQAANRLAAGAGGGSAVAAGGVPREQAIRRLAEIIRAADDYTALFQDLPETERRDLAPWLTVTKALRRAAYLLLRDLVPEQRWFWTEEWQGGERDADADQAANRTTRHADDASFLDALYRKRPGVADACGT